MVAKKEAEKSKILLQVAKITAQAASQEKLIQDILLSAKQFMNAQACSLFLLDLKKQELYSSVFADGIEQKIRFPVSTGIAGSVATTCIPVNIPNAYDDPRFNPEFDKLTSFRTESVLCVPIYGPVGEVVGVTTIINKLDSNGHVVAFNSDDLDLYSRISVFCGLAIHKMLLIQDSQNQKQKLAITLELIGFHSSTRSEQVEEFMANEPGLYEDESMLSWYQYDPHKFLNTDDTLAVISHQMFGMLKFDKDYDIPDYQLVDYLLTVRRSYRPIAYHNFTHAVSVTHGLFVLVVNGILDKYFTRLELFAMLVACLNHDIDVRKGFN
jgi:cAMP and cAMP-inhibited cGMP 3',5'-cyclic phosphodiesterase 10